MGLVFFDDREHFIARDGSGKIQKSFDKPRAGCFQKIAAGFPA